MLTTIMAFAASIVAVIVGLAPAKPLEFVVLRVGRQGNALRMAETTMRRVA